MYEVSFWKGDNCLYDKDFNTKTEAWAEYKATCSDSNIEYVEIAEVLSEQGGNKKLREIEKRFNPTYKPESYDWKREIAMEAGMLHGVDAYNEVMGW